MKSVKGRLALAAARIREQANAQAVSQRWEHPVDKQQRVMIEYLLMKVDAKDWHAVADAAMDLRELAVIRDKHSG